MKYKWNTSNGTTKHQQSYALADLTRQAGGDPDYGIGIRCDELMLPDFKDHGEYAPDVALPSPESGMNAMPSKHDPNAGK